MSTVPVPDDATQGVGDTEGSPMPVDAPWTEDAVLAGLHQHFSRGKDDRWASVAQVTGHDDEGDSDDDALYRRADMVLFRRDQRTRVGLETLALEVKVTRADFLSDLANPRKQATWRALATRHAYVVVPGIAQASEVPEGSGLIVLERLIPSAKNSPTTVTWVRRPAYRSDHLPGVPTATMATLLWRLSLAEGDAKGWGDPTLAGSEFELRQRLKAAERDKEKAERDLANARGIAGAWRSAFAQAVPGGLPCRWCGEGITPLRPSGKGGFGGWRHVVKDDTKPCAVLEEADREDRAIREWNNAPEHVRQAALDRRTGWYLTRQMFDYDNEPWRAFFDVTVRDPEPDLDVR